jgi:hypothetical protein
VSTRWSDLAQCLTSKTMASTTKTIERSESVDVLTDLPPKPSAASVPNSQTAGHKAERPSFIVRTVEQIPEFLRGNPYILSGYRTEMTYKSLAKSVCRKHNETMNIWTHLLAVMFYISLLVYVLVKIYSPDPNLTRVAWWPIVVYIVMLIVSYALSVLCHIFWVHSIQALRTFLLLDFSGMCLTVGSLSFCLVHYCKQLLSPCTHLATSGVLLTNDENNLPISRRISFNIAVHCDVYPKVYVRCVYAFSCNGLCVGLCMRNGSFLHFLCQQWLCAIFHRQLHYCDSSVRSWSGILCSQVSRTIFSRKV